MALTAGARRRRATAAARRRGLEVAAGGGGGRRTRWRRRWARGARTARGGGAFLAAGTHAAVWLVLPMERWCGLLPVLGCAAAVVAALARCEVGGWPLLVVLLPSPTPTPAPGAVRDVPLPPRAVHSTCRAAAARMAASWERRMRRKRRRRRKRRPTGPCLRR